MRVCIVSHTLHTPLNTPQTSPTHTPHAHNNFTFERTVSANETFVKKATKQTKHRINKTKTKNKHTNNKNNKHTNKRTQANPLPATFVMIKATKPKRNNAPAMV